MSKAAVLTDARGIGGLNASYQVEEFGVRPGGNQSSRRTPVNVNTTTADNAAPVMT